MSGQITINPFDSTTKSLTLNYKCISRLMRLLGDYERYESFRIEEFTVEDFTTKCEHVLDLDPDNHLVRQSLEELISNIKDTDKFVVIRRGFEPEHDLDGYVNAEFLGGFQTQKESEDFQKQINWNAAVAIFEQLSKENSDFTVAEQSPKIGGDLMMDKHNEDLIEFWKIVFIWGGGNMASTRSVSQ